MALNLKIESNHLPLVLFDGECVLCHRSFLFLIEHENEPRLFFGTLQDAVDRGFAPHCNFDSLILIQEGRIHTESEAVLRICRLLRFPWNLLAVLRFVPHSIRDLFYHWVAKNRFRWFGKLETCYLLTEDLKNRSFEKWVERFATSTP